MSGVNLRRKTLLTRPRKENPKHENHNPSTSENHPSRLSIFFSDFGAQISNEFPLSRDIPNIGFSLHPLDESRQHAARPNLVKAIHVIGKQPAQRIFPPDG